jgi:serine protease AprX
MVEEKLEPRLRKAIEHRKVRAADRGADTAEVDAAPITVTISAEETITASEGGEDDRATALVELEQRIQESQAPILKKLEQIGAPDKPIVHTLTNAITTELTPKQLSQISDLDEVKLIRHERLDPVTTMNESVREIEVTQTWEDLGYNGRGVRVAVCDTGVDKNHPALLGKVVDEVSLVPTEPITTPGLHATHVAGTIASNDAIYRGVAWQADIVNIKVLTAGGMGQPLWVIQGLEQALRRDARVANFSLGWSEPFHGWVCNDADCILCQAADNAARLGLVVVVAAGNEDNATANPPYIGKFNIRHPGAARRVITIGAVDKAKVLASFSSIGPSSGRLSPSSSIRLTKPDLSGPGVAIVSSVLGGGFAALSGTSMATPHVSGVAALVMQKNPTAKPMMVKKLLEETCEPLDYGPNQTGYGLVNAYSALMRTLA